MPRSLQSILGGSNRVKKPTPRQPPSLQRRQTSSPSPRKKATRKPSQDDQGGRSRKDDTFEDKLEDVGAAQLMTEELTLRDVVQAMRYVRSRMFTPVPSSGFNSTRTAELLNYRASMPPIVTIGHLHAILTSPAKVERELAELQSQGTVRKMRVERRGGQGEAVIESSELENMLSKAGISATTRDKFTRFLTDHPSAQTLEPGVLTNAEADELVRTGFLTSSIQYAPGSTLHVRPEDRTTLTSIEHVSRHASGSVSAVGGRNAIHLAGGGSGGLSLRHQESSLSATSSPSAPSTPAPGVASNTPRSLNMPSSSPDAVLKLAIPGHGRYLKLAAAAIDWLREALGRTKWGECPESWLKERFEGGGLYGPRWKEFSGLEWDWVMGEAVGLGVVELFETGSVGKGVRALGG